MYEIRTFVVDTYDFDPLLDAEGLADAIDSSSEAMLDSFSYIVLGSGFETLNALWRHVDEWLPRLSHLKGLYYDYETDNSWYPCEQVGRKALRMVKIAEV
ncbi:MAG: hypothetical protein M9934_10800 [Thermomicrobiales bacterium]|nr:hypothetical protein [Thermomicrobiales bacterium]MCO5219122.1 hypothetical protein [Thermomicrobiales bacterium]MCO5228754.1 hypothetical protein [Thermomicrobiales bacterium]